MKLTILPIQLFLIKVGLKRKRKFKKYKNYTLMVDAFMKKVYPQ
jgi:hypothetical protein